MSRNQIYTPFGIILLIGCGPQTVPASNPGTPTPVATPSPATDDPTVGAAPPDGGGDEARGALPARPEQAPIVTVEEIVTGKVALGRRVRVTGRCAAAGTGRAAGLWTLADNEASVEVRGLVPKGCPGALGETLTIFAQVERMDPGSRQRVLLRLPD